MPKLLSSIVLLLCAACVADAGQGRRPRSEANSRKERAPVVFLDSTKERDGLKGPVRRVETEIARVELKEGRLVSKSRSRLERTLYDEQGRRIENETYPVVGSQVGQETHKYDAQGNLSETVMRDSRGAVLSRRIYDYKLDEFGNWIQMTASVAVFNAGKSEFEPTEITKRTITYYLVDEGTERNSSGGLHKEADAALVAEGVKVSKREEPASAAKAQRAISPRSSTALEIMNVGVLNNRTTELPRPSYPVSRKQLDVPVTVKVEVVVDITGRVVSAQAQSGPEALREPAESAARRAVFLPFYVAGRPVKARGLINYTFDFLP